MLISRMCVLASYSLLTGIFQKPGFSGRKPEWKRRQTKEGIIADQKMDETQKHKAWEIYVNFHLKKQKGHSEQFQTTELKKHSLRVE